jgi:hypothetical protein
MMALDIGSTFMNAEMAAMHRSGLQMTTIKDLNDYLF